MWLPSRQASATACQNMTLNGQAWLADSGVVAICRGIPPGDATPEEERHALLAASICGRGRRCVHAAADARVCRLGGDVSANWRRRRRCCLCALSASLAAALRQPAVLLRVKLFCGRA